MLKKTIDFQFIKLNDKNKAYKNIDSLIELTLNLIELYKKVFDRNANNDTYKKLNSIIAEVWNNICFNMHK